MVATVEMYEPRMPSWVMVEPMNHTRGYHSSAVLGGSIFTFGGVKGEADTILDVVCSNSKSQFLPCPFGYLYCISYSTKLTPIILNLQSHTFQCLIVRQPMIGACNGFPCVYCMYEWPYHSCMLVSTAF